MSQRLKEVDGRGLPFLVAPFLLRLGPFSDPVMNFFILSLFHRNTSN